MTATYSAFVMAMDRVQNRLRRVSAALDAAGIRYAVIGGNAVAAWVARVDPAATRTTKDVDVLANRADADRIVETLTAIGLRHDRLRDLPLFVDPDEPSRRAGVHFVWAGERVRPSYATPAPSVTDAVRDPEGFMVLGLPALVRMKLTSFRDVDRVHVADLLEVGLIDADVLASLPPELRGRLAEIERSRDDG